MKIEIDGKVYSYVLTKIEDMKARLDGLAIKLADFGQQIDASPGDDILYESVFDEVKSIKSHLDDLHYIMTGGRVE